MSEEELISTVFFSIVMAINGSLFIVQAYKIYDKKKASDLSFANFLGFTLIPIAIMFYAYVRKDIPLFIGTAYNLLGCILVSLLILRYG